MRFSIQNNANPEIYAVNPVAYMQISTYIRDSNF